jgi:hypothetical protein
MEPVASYVISSTGSAMKGSPEKGEVTLDAGMTVGQGDRITTADRTRIGIRIRDYGRITLLDNTGPRFLSVENSSFSLSLESGAILVQTRGLRAIGTCEIITPNTITRLSGPAEIAFFGNTTIVSIGEGKAVVTAREGDGPEILSGTGMTGRSHSFPPLSSFTTGSR